MNQIISNQAINLAQFNRFYRTKLCDIMKPAEAPEEFNSHKFELFSSEDFIFDKHRILKCHGKFVEVTIEYFIYAKNHKDICFYITDSEIDLAECSANKSFYFVVRDNKIFIFD